jgi:hypothetical protein
VKDDDQWGEEIPLSEVVNPLIFHFRPKTFMQVKDEKLKEWEKFFAENVGFPPQRGSSDRPSAAAYPNGGISGSNGGWDD